jgi:hypothetical protein
MSLNVEKIQTILINDPRTEVGRKKYTIYRGPQNNTFQPVTTTNISTNQVVFNIKPQIRNFVNSTSIGQFPVRIGLYSNAPNSYNLWRSGYCAPRAFALQSATATLSCNMGGAVFTSQIGEYIHAMAHVGFGEYMLANHLSGTPSFLDSSQEYIDMVGSINNPLGSAGDKTPFSVMPRGGFPFYNVVYNSPSMVIIDMVLTEEILLSPWNVSKNLHPGFIGLQSIDITFQMFASNAAYRMVSIALGGADAPGPITSSQIAFNDFNSIYSAPFSYSGIQGPQMLMQYLTPTMTESIPMNNIYPLYNVQPFITTYNTAVAPNTSTGFIQTNNVVFGRIPNRILFFARQSDQYLVSSPSNTDTFLAIEKINVFFDNQTGILSSATQYDLWAIARDNGCTLSFSEWSGASYKPGSLTSKMGLTGSILPLVFGKDIPTQPGYAAGIAGQFNFYVQASFFNLDQVNSLNIAIYVVAITEGVMNISNGITLPQYDVISSQDVLNSNTSTSPYVNYNDIKDVSGGNVWTNIKHFGREVWDSIRHAVSELNNAYRQAKPYIDPFIDAGKILLPFLGAGNDDDGGCDTCTIDDFDIPRASGGRAIHKDTLRHNLRSKKVHH